MNVSIEYAKFIQNELWNNNYKTYLIGGSLINAVRDQGKFLSEDLDFAIIVDSFDDTTMNKILQVLSLNVPEFTFTSFQGLLSIYPLYAKKTKIDFFLFLRKHLNYYMLDFNWMHEKIYSFQTFKNQKVVLEDTEFITIYRPDLFLKTIYGNFLEKSDAYQCPQRGDTSHMRECIFYTSEENYDLIDLQYDILKKFFARVVVKRNLDDIDHNKINIYDNCFEHLDINKNLFYSDFTNFLIQKNIE